MLKNNLTYFDFCAKLYPNQKENCSVRDLTFQVTEDCNLKCTYCYQICKTKNKMSFETAKQLIDLIFENKHNPDFYYSDYYANGFVIEFIGGEPFLEVELIEQIIEYFELKFLEDVNHPWFLNHIYNFSSNGTLYFTPKVQQLLNRFGPLISIGITVDGNKELHDKCRLFADGSGSYDLAIAAAISEAQKGYANTKITLSPYNVDYIFDGITNMINLGFKTININCCFEEGWNVDTSLKMLTQLIKVSDWIKENNLYDKIYIAILDFERYKQVSDEKNLKKNWCGVGEGKMLSIDYKGDFYPCIRFMESSLGKDIKPLKIGNIKHGILCTKEEKENYTSLCNCTREKISSEECLNCSINGACAWCTGYNYQYFKNLDKKANFICIPHKIAALATKYLCKIVLDNKGYNNINVNYQMFTNILNKQQFEKIREGKKDGLWYK